MHVQHAGKKHRQPRSFPATHTSASCRCTSSTSAWHGGISVSVCTKASSTSASSCLWYSMLSLICWISPSSRTRSCRSSTDTLSHMKHHRDWGGGGVGGGNPKPTCLIHVAHGGQLNSLSPPQGRLCFPHSGSEGSNLLLQDINSAPGSTATSNGLSNTTSDTGAQSEQSAARLDGKGACALTGKGVKGYTSHTQTRRARGEPIPPALHVHCELQPHSQRWRG